MESFMFRGTDTLYVINQLSSWTLDRLIKAIALDYPLKGFIQVRPLTFNLFWLEQYWLREMVYFQHLQQPYL